MARSTGVFFFVSIFVSLLFFFEMQQSGELVVVEIGRCYSFFFLFSCINGTSKASTTTFRIHSVASDLRRSQYTECYSFMSVDLTIKSGVIIFRSWSTAHGFVV